MTSSLLSRQSNGRSWPEADRKELMEHIADLSKDEWLLLAEIAGDSYRLWELPLMLVPPEVVNQVQRFSYRDDQHRVEMRSLTESVLRGMLEKGLAEIIEKTARGKETTLPLDVAQEVIRSDNNWSDQPLEEFAAYEASATDLGHEALAQSAPPNQLRSTK